MKKIFLYIILLFPIFIYAQDITYLKNKLKSTPQREKALIYCQMSEKVMHKDYKRAIVYSQTALVLATQYKDTNCIIQAYDILGDLNSLTGKLDKAIDYYNKELTILEKMNDQEGIAATYYNIARVYQLKNKTRKSLKIFNQSYEIANKNNYKNLILKNTEALFGIQYAKKNYKDALIYFKQYIKIKDSTFSFKQKVKYQVLMRKLNYVKDTTQKVLNQKDQKILQKDSTINIVSSQRDTLKKVSKKQEKKIEQLNYEKAYQKAIIEKQEMQRNMMMIIIGLIILILIGVFIMYRSKQKDNKKLKEQNQIILQQKEEITAQRDNLEYLNNELNQQKEEITAQRDEIQQHHDVIQQKNENIESSIRYAQRIQQAALPELNLFSELFKDSFIFFKPRDIVSGDFFWLRKVGERIIVTVADCTGHGVPGAFVSMLGISLLNEITQKYPNSKANEILEMLRENIKNSLKQHEKHSESKDGMDMALCIINPEEKTIDYAGANNPLIRFTNGEMEIYKGTKNPVAIFIKETAFKNEIINYSSGDMIYLFSDGYVDQFGGEKSGKYKISRFKTLLKEINDRNGEQQFNIVKSTIENWMNQANEAQLDDITVMGIRL